jgi:hypothetical protein
MSRTITTFLLILSTFTCSAQSVCEKLTQLKQQCYGFKPTELTDKQREEKSAQLDQFWNIAKNAPEKALPCLKDLILNERNDPYFCFDASTLVLSLDKKQQYLDVVLEGVKKTNLKDLQLEPYLEVCYLLGRNGKDIALPAEKLISTPGAHVYLTVHVVDLSAIDASLFLYNTMTTEKAESSLINIILHGNATGKHNAAVVLNVLSTNRGDSLLNNLMAENKLADSTKQFILKDRRDFIANTKTELTAKDEAQVRAERQQSISGLSDEGLQRYFRLTGILLTIRKKHD